MRGVKYQILGLGIILLGMTVPSFSHISYICGALGFGLAAISAERFSVSWEALYHKRSPISPEELLSCFCFNTRQITA